MPDTNEPTATMTPADLPAPVTAQEPTEPEAPAPQAPEDGTAFDAAYIAKLRSEAAEARIKAKSDRERIAAQTVRALVQADGRLVDLDVIAYTPDLIGDDGLVDVDKVTATIDSLIEAKPYLRASRPVASVTQGYQESAAVPTLRDLIQGTLP